MTSDNLFGAPSKQPQLSRLGPIFTAWWSCDDACCGEGIEEGDQIRAYGEGGWIHEGCEHRVQ